MLCPKCSADMETKHIDDVEIDICTGCAGIFLDDGEFESFTGVDPTTGLLRVSKFVKVLSKLNERATIDELTGVFNRKYFSEFTRSVFENPRRGAVTMIGIDIDHFKQFNTKHGHDGGDAVLKSLARLLTSSLRTSRDDYLSLGVALARPGDDADSLYKRADELLYEAKNSGRNKVVMEPEQHR